jgi:dihydrodipicolinate synthase/N-acetylneuraminate lyase
MEDSRLAEPRVRGVIPPLTTPFTEKGEIYEEGLRRLLKFLIERGIHGVFLCGTYGSGPLMSLEQRKRVVEVVMDQAGGRVSVITHVGSASTSEALELARHSEDLGVNAVASVPPYYYRHDEGTVLEYYRNLMDAVEIPVYAYNNPKTTGLTITPRVLSKLADLGVKGIKDSGFNIVEFTHYVLELRGRGDFNFIIGTEALLLPAMMFGASGCVSGLANVFPELVVELYDTIIRKDYEKAAELQLKVNKARKVLHIAGATTAACYAVLKERGVDVGVPKKPILPVTEEKATEMRRAFAEMGLLRL